MTFQDVTKTYAGSKQPAVQSLTWTVEEGCITALAGTSGSGKTTTLRLAAGLERPEQGTLEHQGRVWVKPGHFVPPEKRGIRFVFQDFALFPHWTVLENITRTMTLACGSAARESLAWMGLDGLEKRYPHELSGGQKQRLALARALVEHPSLLLLDEPFNNLDRRTKDEVTRVFRQKLKERGHTCLVVTHEKDEAYALADRIALFHEGRMVQEGQLDEVYRRPRTLGAALFFEKTNYFELRAVSPVLQARLLEALQPWQGAYVGLRPRFVRASAHQATGALPARVLDRRFHGAFTEYEVLLEAGDRLWLQDPTHSLPERVYVSWEPEAVLPFEAL